MKLISLNIWGGKIYRPLINFIKKHSQDTDIFCFQEVFHTTSQTREQAGFRLNLYHEFENILNKHQGFFAPTLDNYIVGSFQTHFIDFNLSSGLAVFINKKLSLLSHRDIFIYGSRNSFDPTDFNSLPRNIQYINFVSQDKKFTVCNLHGLWIRGTKDDTPSRIRQSKQVLKLLKKQAGKKILCGDFNLNMDTQSIKLLESDMINLTKKFHIPTTRNKFYPGPEKYADYTFVSRDVNIKSFEVPKIDVSDHLPMILEFS